MTDGLNLLDILIGFTLGLVATSFSTYLSYKMTERQEARKIEREQEIRAIMEIYSPLVFLLEKNREFFARIIALEKALHDVISKELGNTDINAITKLIFLDVKMYSTKLEDLLIDKLGIVKPKELYLDISLYLSYLNTLVGYCSSLQSKDINIEKLKEVLSSFFPILAILEKATSNLREMALAKTMHISKYSYKPYFTEKVRSNIEDRIDNLNIKIYGSKVPEWEKLFKRDTNR